MSTLTRDELLNEIQKMSRGCINKTAYRTEDWVNRVGRDCMTARPQIELHYYKCSYCACFHLTRKITQFTTPVNMQRKAS